MARITLWGMYQYDPTLFDNAALPAEYSKELLINKIMADMGQLYPYYQTPVQLKENITRWFSTRFYDFQHMYDALHAQYDPIENYNRIEENDFHHDNRGSDTETTTLGSTETTEYGRKDTNTYGRSDTTTYGRKEDTIHGMKTVTTPDTETITEGMVSAYDSTTYQPRTHDVQTNSGTTSSQDSGTDTVQLSGSDKTESGGSDSAQLSGSDALKRSGSDSRTTEFGSGYDDREEKRIHGNIGVTTNQQMIISELDMRMQYDLYSIISSLFEKEFIVQVY